MKIEKNLGTVDRALRIIAGAALLLAVPLVYAGPGYEWALWGLVGLMPLLSGLAGYCPPYDLLGINTRKKSSQPENAAGDECSRRACC